MENKIVFYLAISALASLLLVVVLVDLFMIIRNKNQRIKYEKQLREAEVSDLLQQQELSMVNAALEGQDKERHRIAQELHDSIGSTLSLAKMHFSEMEKEIQELKIQNTKKYAEFGGLLEKTMDDVRRISHDLYGSTVMKLGLPIALEQLAKALEHSKKIRMKVHTIQVPSMSFDTEIHIYRIIQELLSNSLKYAEATRIDVQLIGGDSELTLSYEDNGKGFDTALAAKSGGIGLKTMESRMLQLKGNYVLESRPGNGMQIHAQIPIPDAAQFS